MEEAWKSSIFVIAGEEVVEGGGGDGVEGRGAGRDKAKGGMGGINGNQQEAH